MASNCGIAWANHAWDVFAVPAALALAASGVLVAAGPVARAQRMVAPAPQSSTPVKERFLVSRFPLGPSLLPTVTIPLDPLGFSAPGPIYLGARNALASLDFLDENRLLFTFRIPGLLHRDLNGEESDERRIRAVVLVLPQGTVEAETSWTVHDHTRYVWMLKDGHFYLRDRNNLLEGDSKLVLKPFLEFPGSLLWLELDATQQFLVTNSFEPVAPPQKSEAPADASSSVGSKSGQVSSPSIAAATVTTEEGSAASGSGQPDLVVRILRRADGEVMLVSRVRSEVHLAINSAGYLENVRGRGAEWLLNFNYFTGGSKTLGSVDSACEPKDDFISEQEILVTSCGSSGESKLVAMTTSGRTLWETGAPPTEVWPHLAVAGNGLRLAWETLDADYPVNSYAPMAAANIKEQSVTVFDAANGYIALVSPVSPILDVGGNVAISPSGRRVALLNAGAIQVFDLPAPPPLPRASSQ